MQNYVLKLLLSGAFMKVDYCLKVALVAALAGILFGYDTGVMSGAILFVAEEFGLDSTMNGIVVGAVLFGALLGAAFSGRIADALGRKKLLILTAIAFILGSIGTAFSPSIATLTIGRLFIGFAIGIASYTAPLYISEISPADKRGQLVSLNQLAISLGILISYIVDFYAASYFSQNEWRWMLGLGVVPAIFLLIGMIYLPDSPRWVFSKGRESEAKEILQKIRGPNVSIENELGEIRMTLKEDREDWRLLFSKTLRPAIYTGFGLAAIQQITGINTILYYAPTILRLSGFESNNAAIFATMGIGVVFVLFTLLSLRLIDTLGRKPLLFMGLLGMSLGLSLLVFVFANPKNQIVHWLAISSMLLYIASFAVSLGPVVWLLISEIYPLKIRGIGASLATCVNWGSNLIVTATFLSLVDWIEVSGTFSLYLSLSLFSLFFIYYFVPETKGVTLEKIEEHLMANKPFRELKKPVEQALS
ncbi:sugar porter family MFS transporter [Criblamydia sequanensis]|uniref:D-xylose-proton symporter n=1 Tax=Candidatus Criblamydia sequanensis CRIB-18 TaxID=1437425 RepID=A0A090CYC5_9BACT|nr:sugar porter family MFS transporter [Criblamydia sequanensis]CDR33502.1 putative D-xylose-proton symporter [Criblamydia sequanensis CRIB-18]